MISIVKYISEIGEGGGDYDKDGNPTPAHFEALKRLKARRLLKQQESQGTRTKLLKKVTPENTPVPAAPPDDHTIYTNPIKKFINAIKQ